MSPVEFLEETPWCCHAAQFPSDIQYIIQFILLAWFSTFFKVHYHDFFTQRKRQTQCLFCFISCLPAGPDKTHYKRGTQKRERQICSGGCTELLIQTKHAILYLFYNILLNTIQNIEYIYLPKYVLCLLNLNNIN